MKVIDGGFSNIAGFTNLGKYIGIKKEGKDLGILYSEKICSAAAVYTKNSVKGAPLYITRENLADGKAQAIVVNSRVANVATGEQGKMNAKKTTELVAAELGINQSDVLVASTGVIGPQLPMDKIESGIKGVKNELKPDGDFAEAIMTTDTHKKEMCVDLGSFKIAAAAKGSGMIAPNMATLLVFIATDAEIASDKLQQALKTSVDKTLNMTSIDTDTSTSDMAIIMANGSAGSVDYSEFSEALDYVCLELTKMIVMDGEGVTKLITCEIKGAKSEEDAKKAAKAVIDSPLVKTAVYGNDPNWGRLMMAIGKSGAELNEEKITIHANNEPIVESGKASETYDDKKLTQLFKDNKEINFVIDLGAGEASATAYGCDLTEEYIRINAEYTT
ncbi:MAG TPA: bifunctional glutamate N-acetyltransferase/amino-acid acetyltransferase ArgJ [Candidatus Saccharimonadales bacterium]|nr:bifunctional glutamate N-acetyltransferase/amino-acid acetyltransferase ArgJ [Candidatus Saccharimonadales bacterium]